MPIATSSVVDYISGHYARLRFIVVGICQQEFYFGNGPELKRHLIADPIGFVSPTTRTVAFH